MKKISVSIILLLGSSVFLFSQVPLDGLIGYWPFSGNANDWSGNNLHGTVFGAELTTDRFGIPKCAYEFDYSQISVPDNDSLDFTNHFSLCAWFKTNRISWNPQGILGKTRPDGGDGYMLNLNNPGNIFGYQPGFPNITFGMTGAYSRSDSINNINTWHFVVGTYDGDSMKLYIDGALDSVSYVKVTLANSDSPLTIGMEDISDGDSIRYFHGAIDDVRLYNRAISQFEVLALFNETKCSETYYDTVHIEVYDTTFITITDTITVNDTIPVYNFIAVTDTLIIDVTFTGINPPNNTNIIKIYPNPAKDVIYIQIGPNYAEMSDYKIKIINSLSQVIFETNVNQQLYAIDINQFGAIGLYFIQIFDDSNTLIDNRKILLE